MISKNIDRPQDGANQSPPSPGEGGRGGEPCMAAMAEDRKAVLPPAILLMGPTASGKTAAALDLATRFPVEIVSVDSAQVFRDMNIGTAKPDRATLERFPHHLIDLVTPEERYSAARFREDALRVMAQITARGNVPLLVGGTMLYFKALRQGLADLPQADRELRAAIGAEAQARGWPAMHAELARLDPASAARLAPNDGQRIQRALEVVRLSGEPLDAFFARQSETPPPYRMLALALLPSDRSVLHDRIAMRFDAMLEEGLVAEVETLRARYRLDAGMPSMRCVGYRQVWEMLEGRLPSAQLRDRGVFATRQFAKRQLTWLKSTPEIALIDCLDAQSQAKMAGIVEDHLSIS